MTVHWSLSHRPSTLPEAPEQIGENWARHPIAATLVEIVVLLGPLAAGLVSAWQVADALPRAGDWPATAGQWVLVLLASLAAVWVATRAVRRLVPLAMLLDLSLLFPDHAPNRYRIAARAGVTRRLAEQVAVAHESGICDDPTRAAERVLGLLAALAAHDSRTRGHCERVRAYNDLISEQLGLPIWDRERLRWAALIHDIGKLDVPVKILNKPASLDTVELEVVRQHPLRGLAIAAPLAAWLGEWATGIDQHHERWDGSGYPYGLAGREIGFGARIVAVADAFEVMTAPRPYSRPISPRAAREELVRHAGGQFDPQVVRAFLNISLGRLRAVIGPLGWLSALPFLPGRLQFTPNWLPGGTQLAATAGSLVGAGAIAAAVLQPAAGLAQPTLERPPTIEQAPNVGPASAAARGLDPRRSLSDQPAPQVAPLGSAAPIVAARQRHSAPVAATPEASTPPTRTTAVQPSPGSTNAKPSSGPAQPAPQPVRGRRVRARGRAGAPGQQQAPGLQTAPGQQQAPGLQSAPGLVQNAGRSGGLLP